MRDFVFDIVKGICWLLFGIAMLFVGLFVLVPRVKEESLILKLDPEYCVVTKVAFASNIFSEELRVYYDVVYDLEGKEKIVSKYLIVPDDAFYIYEAGMRFENVTDIQAFAKDQVGCDDEKEIK